MDATFLRSLQRAIKADADCAPFVHTNDMPPPTAEVLRNIEVEPAKDGKPARYEERLVTVKIGAHRKDARIAEILNAKGGLDGREVTGAEVSRAVRGPWGDEEA